jgi:hypothetical protein
LKLSVIFAELASHGSEALSDGPRIIIVHPDFSTSIPPASTPTASRAADAHSPIPAVLIPAPPALPPNIQLGQPSDSASQHEAAPHESGQHETPPPLAVPLRKIRSDISIGDIVQLTERAGFGFIMAFIAIVSIPFVGMSLPFGLAITGLAWQLLLGRKEPWLPKRVREHLVSIRTIDIIANRIARVTKGMEKVFKPRLTFLTSGFMLRVLAFCILVQAIGLAAPMPIPGSNWFFIVPIVVFSVALMEEDGVLVLVGHLLQIAQVVFLWTSWKLIEPPMLKLLHLMHGWWERVFGG